MEGIVEARVVEGGNLGLHYSSKGGQQEEHGKEKIDTQQNLRNDEERGGRGEERGDR